MDKNKKLSFQKEMEREAKKIEEELKAHPELNDITVSEELDAALLEQIQAYDKEQKKDNTETEKKIVKFPRKKKLIFTLVAVLVLVCAMGVTSMGSKSYLKKTQEGALGKQKLQNVDVEDMETLKTEEDGEITAFQEIHDKIGISSVRLKYKPRDMEFLRCQIDQEEQRAKMFYVYEGNMVRYDIYKNESDSSLGQSQEDEVLEEEKIITNEQVVSVKKILVKETKEERSVLSFRYKDVNYQLYGVINMKEMKKIAENLKFL